MSNQLQVSGAAKIRSIQGPVVANSGVITALDGDASQYVRGDGTLADFPTSTGGGSSVSYYLNSSVSQGTIGGVAYRQLSKVPISGAGTDITTSANGYIASYITDANDPALLEVPAGNFNCEFYFSVNSNSHNPYVYAELYKYDGTTFTLLGSNVAIPEYLTNGTTLSAYYFAIPVATSVLTVTDRISIRIYVNVDGRTVTLHTENNHLCQVVTTFSKGLISLNNLTRQNQFFQTGTSGTDFAISSTTATHTFNLPVASASNTGKLSSTDWSTFNGKVPYTGAIANVDLGGNDLSGYYINGTQLTAKKVGSTGGALFIETGSGYVVGGVSGIAMASGSANNLSLFFIDATATNTKNAILNFASLTNNTNRTYTLPDASGTIALTSSLASYVPYTGATADVDLGIYGLFANLVAPKQIILKKDTILGGAISIETGSGFAWGGSNDTILLASGASNTLSLRSIVSSVLRTAILDFSTITASSSRTFTLPDASGTIALTSNLSSYVPYTGATTNVNLGVNDFTSRYVNSQFAFIQGDGTMGGVLGFTQYATSYTSTSNNTNIYALGNNKINFSFYQIGGAFKIFNFDVSSLDTTNTRAYTLPNASGTLALTSDLGSYVTLATTQTISANKTFSEFGFFDKGVLLKQNIYPSASGYNGIGAISGGFYFSLGQTTVQTLLFNTSTPYQYTFPSATGTLALTSDLTSFVTLTGTQTLSNKSFSNEVNLSSNGFILAGTGGVNPLQMYSTANTSTFLFGSNSFGTNINNNLFYSKDSNNRSVLVFNNTAERTYTFPNATGTLALTSDLGSYLPLTGGTLTGQLYINPTNTGTVGLDVASNNTRFRSDNLEGFKRQLVMTMGSGTLIQLTASGFGGTYGTDLAFYTSSASGVNAQPAIYITGGNNVGIGTGNASSPLDVVADNSTAINLRLRGRAADSVGQMEFWNNAQSTRYGYIATDSTSMGIVTTQSIPLVFGTNSAEKMRITSAGNVGIGTSSPFAGGNPAKLQVKTATDINLAIQTGTADATGVKLNAFNDAASVNIPMELNGSIMILKTGETERMRITSGGNVGIGNTGNASVRLFVTGVDSSTSNYALILHNGSGQDLFYVRNDGYINTGTRSGSPYNLPTTGRSAVIESNGGLGYTTSTRESKTNINSITDINWINQLNPVSFNYRKKDNELNFTEEYYEEKSYGFIADEVEQVNPDFVFYDIKEDGTKKLAGVEYNNMIAILTKAIQEMNTKLDAQNQTIQNLQEQINELKNK